MTRVLGWERWNLGQMYDGLGLELWAYPEAGDMLSSHSEEDLPTLRHQMPQDRELIASTGGTVIGEGLDCWIPFLSAGSSAICSEDLHHRSTLSYNHPNPFTSTTTTQFGLPRASSLGLAIYEDTSLLVNKLMDRQPRD
jgi:hypothetical protein